MSLAYAAVGPHTRDNWQTPPELFEPLDRIFRFTLDAAADETNHMVRRWMEGPHEERSQHFPELERPGYDGGWRNLCICGLCSDWMEETVWCHPPYGAGIGDWVGKCALAAARGATVVALLPAATDTRWFRQVWRGASEIWILAGRVQFEGTTSSNPKGSVIAVYRPEPPHMERPAPRVRLWDWRAEVPA